MKLEANISLFILAYDSKMYSHCIAFVFNGSMSTFCETEKHLGRE
jgi:hypothetical protein